jgi:hypothetical protein
MAKLTLYERAVKKFGEAGALLKLKELNFRDFQSELSVKKPNGEKAQEALKDRVSSQEAYETQQALILGLNLAPNEKRLLRIIAKGGIYYQTIRLTEEQVVMVEARLRQHRMQVLENNLKNGPTGVLRKSFDPKNPLEISGDLYNLTNANEIILRIRAGLALVAPARRTIAVLLFRLFSEKLSFESLWKHPREGVEYKSFRDFAMDELGMGEDYRDYLAVGRVLRDHCEFLDGLSDLDTETVFLKLRYLPAALYNHRGEEPLILARLHSLTVREFKLFSTDPDFEITFSKRFTKKQLGKFNELLHCTRDPYGICDGTSVDFIEAYHENEFGIIERIVSDVIGKTESMISRSLPSSIPEMDKPESSDPSDEFLDVDFQSNTDDSHPMPTLPTA